jgi:cytochrome c peroxidase
VCQVCVRYYKGTAVYGSRNCVLVCAFLCVCVCVCVCAHVCSTRSHGSIPASTTIALWLGAGVLGVGLGVYQLNNLNEAHAYDTNWDEIREEIASLLDNADYDDGSYGPILVRLAWHASGTYSTFSKDGGSDGATMRFCPESRHGANAGLGVARDLLEPIKRRHPEISYADLWTLAGSVAIEEMGGPKIQWRAGRTDAVSGDACPPDGRLPDAALAQDHVRSIFYRMGFNDREIVALVGAHALGT